VRNTLKIEILKNLRMDESGRCKEAAASLSSDFPPPHRFVSAKMIFKVAPTSRRELQKARGLRWLIAGE
jgi:hypothetical protein